MTTKIVLTGGACGGKTSTLKYLEKRLPELGIKPFFVPELATTVFSTGVRWTEIRDKPTTALRFQSTMFRMQLENENNYSKLFSLDVATDKVIICDRGAIDNLAYVKDTEHERMISSAQEYLIHPLASMSYTSKQLFENIKQTYSGIIHLTTAAYGEWFNSDNPARYETPQEARQMCDRTFNIWSKGPSVYHVRIAPSTCFNEKMERVAQEVVHIYNLDRKK